MWSNICSVFCLFCCFVLWIGPVAFKFRYKRPNAWRMLVDASTSELASLPLCIVFFHYLLPLLYNKNYKGIVSITVVCVVRFVMVACSCMMCFILITSALYIFQKAAWIWVCRLEGREYIKFQNVVFWVVNFLGERESLCRRSPLQARWIYEVHSKDGGHMFLRNDAVFYAD